MAVSTAHFAGALLSAEYGGGSFFGINNVGINAGWDLMLPLPQLAELQSLATTAQSSGLSQRGSALTLSRTNSGGLDTAEVGLLGGVGSELAFAWQYLSEFIGLLAAIAADTGVPDDYEGEPRNSKLTDAQVEQVVNSVSLSATYVTPPAVSADTLVVVGNSIAEGAGAQPGLSLASLTAQALGMTEENYAVSGSVVQSAPELRGLYNRVLTKLYPPAAAPLGTVACMHLILTGINDMYGLPQYLDGYRIVDYVVRAAIHRFRAVATLPANSASVVYAPATGSGTAGAWSSVTSAQYFSGTAPSQATPNPIGAVRQTVTDGNTYTFTVPAWWPAGRALEVWGHNIGSAASYNGGAVHSWVKSGGASGSYDSRNRTTIGLIAPWHYDVPNCQPGDVVTVTISGMTVNGDYVTGFQCPSDDAPPVVIAGIYKPPSYGTGTHNPTDADVDTANALLRAIPASFADGRVVFVDTDAIMNKDVSLFAVETPQVHPNTEGHRRLAVEGFIPAFRKLLPSTAVRARARRRPEATQAVRVVRNFDMHDSIGIGTLAGGAASISSRAIVNTDAMVFLTPIGAGAGSLSRGTITPTSAGTAGTCVVASTDAADARQFQWWVVNPSRVI